MFVYDGIFNDFNEAIILWCNEKDMVRKKKKEEKEAKEENIERVRAHKISMFENVLLYFELVV
jgi:GTP1/Obg family GTP-binding protein